MRKEVIGPATLYLGDCLTVLPPMQGDVAVISDPPYGIGYSHGVGGGKLARSTQFDHHPVAGDDKPFDPAPWLSYGRVVLFGANHYASRLPDSSFWLVWDKRDGVCSNDQADCEMAWVKGKGNARIIRHLWNGMLKQSERGEIRQHPTQKPVAVMEWAITQVGAKGTILDPYMGSGKGGNPKAGKQATNKGSQSIGVLYGKTGETAREAALTNVSRRWTTEAGIAPKNLVGIPWRVAFALQAAGWWLRQDIIWSKPNPMPESVTDRCTKAHEYIFLLAKSERYYFDAEAIAEEAKRPEGPGNINHAHSQEGIYPDGAAQKNLTKIGPRETANKRSVWTVTTQPFKEAHFATFPPALIEPCILAGCPAGGTVLDPFGGAGTTGLVADRHGRDAILIELNPEYAEMARKRIFNDSPLFAEVQ